MKNIFTCMLLAVALLSSAFKSSGYKKVYKVAVTYMDGKKDTLVFVSSTSNNIKANKEKSGYCLTYRVAAISKDPLVLTCSVKHFKVVKKNIDRKEKMKYSRDEYFAFVK